MNLKNKTIVLFLIIFAILLITPSMVNATTYIYSDTEQGMEWSYELDSNENVVNLKCNTTSKIGAVTIPSTIDGKTVISIGKENYQKGAFENCAGITSVTIPNTIAIIGYNAFYNCTGLKTVTIPNSVTKISDSAFYNCAGLTTITFSENLTSIGASTFSNCKGLKSIIIPDSVTTIGDNAFKGCSGLKEITLSNSLSKISKSTFGDCTGLTSVVIPNSVTTIEGGYAMYGAFYNCENLTKILVPDTVASIGRDAFGRCPKLTIYGNDGQTSKKYAEENEIKFDYISNWNKQDPGIDITSPTVENIQVTYASVMNYNRDENKSMYIIPAGAKLVINVTFSEVIEGTKIPTLTVKFGEGENIKLTEGIVGGATITYVYTIQNTDIGVMTTVDFSGGNIKDSVGNIATLSCPALKIQNSTEDFVYANGTVTNPGTNDKNQGTDNKDENNQKPNTSDDKKDNTTAKEKIPKAGKMTVISILIITIIAGTTSFIITRKYKGI